MERAKTFTLFWLTGVSQIVTGSSIANAMNNSGIGNVSLKVLDFYVSGNAKSYYKWDSKKRTWNRISNNF